MCRVVEINDIRELSQYRLAWRNLIEKTRQATFFQTLDWLNCYWECYGQGQRLRCLVVEREREVSGIVPLVVTREPTRLGRIDVLTYPLNDWGSFFGPIGPDPTATLMAAMRYLASCDANYDLLNLRWIDSQRVDFGRHRTAMRMAGLTPQKSEWSQVAFVDTSTTWSEYFGQLSSKQRNNYRRIERRLNERGDVRLERYRPLGAAYGDSDPRWDLYDACEQLASRSWQGRLKRGTTLSNASVRGFLRKAHEAAAHAGALDLNLLYVADRPVAFGYNYHWNGYVSALRTGYDAEVRDGVGTVLMGRMIRDSIERDDHTIDLGGQYLGWKTYWSTGVRPSDEFIYYPPFRARAQALRWKRRFSGWLLAGRRDGKANVAS